MRYAYLMLVLFFTACQKEFSYEGANLAPIAKAGSDTILQSGTDSILLNGSSSTDPDGNITGYAWSQISGPTNAVFTSQDVAVTKAKTLTTGSYLFELKVTDNSGADGFDTMQVTILAPGGSGLNASPFANAGNDMVRPYNLPDATLDGSGSFDADGTIIAYSWESLQPGPIIVSPTNTITQVTGLNVGSNYFKLTVTDNSGASDNDTVDVIVTPPVSTGPCQVGTRPIINAMLTPFDTLTWAQGYVQATAVGNKIVFIGGSQIEVYNLNTNTSSGHFNDSLGMSPAIATLGSKVLIAGGHDLWSIPYSGVSIYDASSNTWTKYLLSSPRSDLTATGVGNTFIVAGGQTGSGNFPAVTTVDMFDVTTNTWSTAQLSVAKAELKGIAANGKALFLGGFNNAAGFYSTTEMFDPQTGLWSVPFTYQLDEPKSYVGAIVANNKLIIAGGKTPPFTIIDKVEIIDLSTGNKTLNCLSIPGYNLEMVQKGNDVVIFTRYPDYTSFDIYNVVTGEWSIGKLPFSVSSAGIVCVNNEIYVGGGYLYGQSTPYNILWKLTW